MKKRLRGKQYLPSKTFCLKVPRNFVGDSFSVSLNSGAEKVWIREGGLSRFSVEKYLSHSAENFRGWRESLSVSFILGIDKVWTRGGGRQYQDFPSKFFCLTVPEEFLREHFRVSFISGMGNFLLQRVMSRFSILCRNFFVSQC